MSRRIIRAALSICISSILFCMVASADDRFVDLTGDQIEVRALVKLVHLHTGRKFIVDEDVKGKVTIMMPRIPADQVYPLFVSILESIGCSVADNDGVYRVVSVGKAAIPMAKVFGPDDKVPAEGLLTKVIRLEHVNVADMQKALSSMLGQAKTGAMAALESTGHLIITDSAENVRRIGQIVAQVDKPGLARVTEIVELEHADAKAMANQLETAMEGLGGSAETRASRLRQRLGQPASVGSRQATIVAAPHSNSLILVGTAAQLKELKRIVKRMDVDASDGRGRLNAIFLKYISAEDTAKNLNELLSKSILAKQEQTGKRVAIAIQASVENNALLVDAMPHDFALVSDLVAQLDTAPRQVLIEVVIAEVSVNDELDIAVELAAIDEPSKIGDSVIRGSSTFKDGAENLMNAVQQGVFPRGIAIGIAQGSRVDGEGGLVSGIPGIINIDAMKRDRNFKIKQMPSLLAQNNKEASVSIVNEIPILKSTIRGAGADKEIVENIERIEVGIKLKIKPQVNAGSEVMMNLNTSIEAVIDPGPSGTRFAPTIARREVSTSVTVPDGHTVVISGLTKENETKIVKRVPVLGSMPLIGMLFRRTVKTKEETNLLIFVTPHIVADPETARKLADEWQKRTGLSAEGKSSELGNDKRR